MHTAEPGGLSEDPTGDDGRYEFKTVKVVRGREASVAAKEEGAGWKLVTEDKGPIRTELTFSRLKPKAQRSRQFILLGSFLLVITLAIGIGVWSERGASTNAADSSSEGASEEPDTEKPSEADPDEDEERNPKYGETVQSEVRHTCRGGSEDCVQRLYLEVTVSKPVEVKPNHPAEATQAANVYFTITVKNTSAKGEFDLFTFITEAGIGDPEYDWGPVYGWEPGERTYDLDADTSGGQGTLHPGQSATFKEGWSVSSLDNLALQVRPAGLAGDILVFTPR